MGAPTINKTWDDNDDDDEDAGNGFAFFASNKTTDVFCGLGLEVAVMTVVAVVTACVTNFIDDSLVLFSLPSCPVPIGKLFLDRFFFSGACVGFVVPFDDDDDKDDDDDEENIADVAVAAEDDADSAFLELLRSWHNPFFRSGAVPVAECDRIWFDSPRNWTSKYNT